MFKLIKLIYLDGKKIFMTYEFSNIFFILKIRTMKHSMPNSYKFGQCYF